LSGIAFLFPGQGAQSVGMGASLASQYPRVGALYERASAILGYDLARICFEGPEEDLDSTVYSQPALFVTSLCALEALRQRSPEIVDGCRAAAGLSLGEYTAMVFAGVMDFEAALKVVQQRGEAMQEAADRTPSGMVSILGMDADQVQQLCGSVREEGEILQPANYLCPANIAVSGHNAACERLAEAAQAAGAMKVVPLAVAGAFHTPIMDTAVARLTAALQDVPLSKPRIPVVSNVDAQPHDDPEEIRRLLIQQVVSPVRWEDSMRFLLDQGLDGFYEVGPGRVLRGLLKRIQRKVSCESVAC
jgi:[acyl-carrier-protein] S-malonyltransferase